MTAQILDGKALAEAIRKEIAAAVPEFSARAGRPPSLDVVLVGADPASQIYVRNKQRAAKAVGVRGTVHLMPVETTEAELLAKVDALNNDPSIDGILVQTPLPQGLCDRVVIERIDPSKDIDGFHPQNVGLLAVGAPRLVSCTPLGIQRLLVANDVPTRGAHAVILGRSNIVGKPMALLLLQKGQGGDATVTVCHTATKDARALARQADILIVAMGRAESVGADWVKPGAAVIDVGMHRRSDGSFCGDVKLAEVAEVAGWLTPVPGGVGPMTVAMLLSNTLQAARMRLGL